MLLPTTANASMLSASRSAFSKSTAQAVERPPPSPAALPPPPSQSAGDLTTQLREQLEQDPDYQILRRAFPLSVSSAESPATPPPTQHTQTSGSTTHDVFMGAYLSDGSISSTNFTLDGTWNQTAFSQFQFSATSSDPNFAFQSAQLTASIGEDSAVQTGDPLVLDLSGRGIATTGIEAGVQFDLTGDGQLEQMSFVTGDSWFLALDSNDNGRIDSGRELFGDQNGAEHGFAELARHDGNADGVIDANDEVFSRLRLLQIDSRGEQVTQTLDEAGVTAINLGYQNTRKALNAYDYVAQIGQFQRTDGSAGEASDVQLGYQRLA